MECGIDVTFDDEKGELISWRVSDGTFVNVDAVLLHYKSSDGSRRSLKTHTSGVVTVDTTVRKGKLLEKGMVVASLKPCTHAIVIKEMCASCGKDLREKCGSAGEASTADVPMIHHVPELIVSRELARKIGNRDRELLLKARKLVLLVDLDQTIIHSTNCHFKMENVKDIFHYKLQGTDFYTKVRPYTYDFLRRMSKLFEMHIISHSDRLYAHRIAEMIDPDRQYFGHRILSRDELFCAMYKTHNMQSLFPCGDQMITMIDDRSDVWQYSDALVQVKPFRYFNEYSDTIVIPTSPTAEAAKMHAEADSESENDDSLQYVASILSKIHAAFYELYDDSQVEHVPDLKCTIAYLRRQVLHGCSIVLSGIVPIGVEPSKTEVHRLCLQFGATVTERITNQTTHVIAARWGTSKVYEAKMRPQIAIVSPKWLFVSVERWEKADENEFALKMETVDRQSSRNIMTDQLSNMPTIGKETLLKMTDEVDEALSEDAENDLQGSAVQAKSSPINADAGSVKHSKRKPLDGEATETISKKIARENHERESSTSSTSMDDKPKESSNSSSSNSDDEMAAAVEKQFFS